MSKKLPYWFRLILSCCLLHFLPFLLSAQSTFDWARQLGGAQADAGNAISTDLDGNVYTAGTFSGLSDFAPAAGSTQLTAKGNIDGFITKHSASGSLLWVKQIGGTSASVTTRGITTDNKGNTYTTGQFAGNVDFDPGVASQNLSASGTGTDAFILKLDPAGNFVWVKPLQGTGLVEGISIDLDPFGHLYTTGRFDETADFDPGSGTYSLSSSLNRSYFLGDTFITYDYNAFLVKMDTSGSFIWAKNVVKGNSEENPGGANATPASVSVDPFGNIYLSGRFTGDSVDFNPGTGVELLQTLAMDVFISKLDSSGNLIWAKSWGATSDQWSRGSAVDRQGNVYVTTFTQDDVDFDPGTDTFLIVSQGTVISKLDASGTFQWAKLIQPQTIYFNSEPYGIATDPQGGVYITGKFNGTNDFNPDSVAAFNMTATDYINDAYILKLDTRGSFVWAKQLGGNADDIGRSIHVDNKGSIYTTGTFNMLADFDPATTTFEMTSKGNTDVFVHKMTQSLCAPTAAIFTIKNCDSATINDQTYYKDGTYSQTLVNAAGCDSVLTINLTLHPTTYHTLIPPIACDSLSVNETTYYTNGTYTQKLVNSAGCDSILSIVVAIKKSVHQTLDQNACGAYLFNGKSYTQSGVYKANFPAANGCDSIVTLNLTITGIDTAISSNGASLIAQQDGATYQWFNCSTQALVLGAKAKSYTPVNAGNYAVIISLDGCSDTSRCYTTTLTGIDEWHRSGNLQLYPNPTSGKITLSSTESFHGATVHLYNIVGQELFLQKSISGTSFSFDMDLYSPGTYIIEIENAGVKKKIKLVKE